MGVRVGALDKGDNRKDNGRQSVGVPGHGGLMRENKGAAQGTKRRHVTNKRSARAHKEHRTELDSHRDETRGLSITEEQK